MFGDIRKFMSLNENDCTYLTHHNYNSIPIDIQEKSSDIVIPDYYNEPYICLSNFLT